MQASTETIRQNVAENHISIFLTQVISVPASKSVGRAVPNGRNPHQLQQKHKTIAHRGCLSALVPARDHTRRRAALNDLKPSSDPTLVRASLPLEFLALRQHHTPDDAGEERLASRHVHLQHSGLERLPAALRQLPSAHLKHWHSELRRTHAQCEHVQHGPLLLSVRQADVQRRIHLVDAELHAHQLRHQQLDRFYEHVRGESRLGSE